MHQTFIEPRARNTDPASAHSAAAHIGRSALRLQEIVEQCLREYGPQTTHEIAERTGLTVVTVSPRIKPLRLLGRVRASGDRREGRSVWEAV